MTAQQRADSSRVVQQDGRWWLDGDGPADLAVVDEFLGCVADRGYSPRTQRAYAFDLLAFTRWLVDANLSVGVVTTDALLRFLTFCRSAVLLGQAGGNVVPLRTGRSAGYELATINRRLAAISGLFDFRGDAGSGSGQPGAADVGGPAVQFGAAARVVGASGRAEVPFEAAGAGSPGVCLAGWIRPRPLRCWAVSAPTGTRRSPG
jgi:hypothetical protein